MRILVLPAYLLVACSLLTAQSPQQPSNSASTVPPDSITGVSAPALLTFDLGFKYSLPSDWEVVDTKPMLPVVRQQLDKDATKEGEKKGIACVEAPLKATHGDLGSTIVLITLSYDCYGQKFVDSDLPSFAGGVAGGLKKSWNIIDPAYGAYTLGSHSVWIERASGNPIAHPETKRLLEVACTLLKNGAVCWMAFAANEADLATFEHSLVTLGDEAPKALVPPATFVKKSD
jgi:hypothetical protein